MVAPAPPCQMRKALVITAAMEAGINPKNKPEMLNNIERVSKTTPGENGMVESITAIPNPLIANPDMIFSQMDFRLDFSVTNPYTAQRAKSKAALFIRPTKILSCMVLILYFKDEIDKGT